MGDTRSKTGTLYVVATPIGNLGDMSHRAVTTLQSVDVIAAEDTRQTSKLCVHYSIDTPLLAYHEHNEVQQTPALLKRLLRGDEVAVVSDAGTPLISDPGFRLVSAARDASVNVIPIPGPCAGVAALSVAGLSCHRFHFEGFLPAKPGARANRLQALRTVPDTLIFYESVHRIEDSLRDMAAAFGGARRAVLARELTKLHETIFRNSLDGILEWLTCDPQQRKGEHVIVVEGGSEPEAEESERVLDLLSEQLPLSQAAELAAKISGVSRNRLYKKALSKHKGR